MPFYVVEIAKNSNIVVVCEQVKFISFRIALISEIINDLSDHNHHD